MKNYLDHEIKVKYVDGILAKSQKWQWFIDCIESDFDLDDILTYADFKKKYAPLVRILENFLKILEVSDKTLEIKKPVLKDVYNIACFSIGSISVNDSINIITTNIGKIIFVIVRLTKLENSDNEIDYITDMRFLTQKNFFQTINMYSFITEEDSIFKYLDTIDVKGFDEPKRCIMDNLKKVSYGLSDDFFETYEEKLLSANAFEYQPVQKKEYLTWQEDTLLDMISISIYKHNIVPVFKRGNVSFPDYTLWTSNLIGELKIFFNNHAANFVLESIDYVNNSMKPSNTIIDEHCRMLNELIKNGNESNIYLSSTYSIISLMFKERLIKTENSDDALELIKSIQQIESVKLLLKLKEDGFPLSKEQSLSIKKYITDQYKRIDKIDSIDFLNEYLSNKDIAKNITQEYYDKLKLKFLLVIIDLKHQLIPTVFYQAMLFLIDVNQTNQQVDRRIVKRDMIRLQEYWQNDVYEEKYKNLQKFKYSTSIPSIKVDEFNNNVLANPILISQMCLRTNTDSLIDIMKTISKHPMLYLCKKMLISPIYPLDESKENFDNHEIDKLLKEQVDEIKSKYQYKFLNVLDTEKYILGIYEMYRTYASMIIPLFKEDEMLYRIIEGMLNIKLIPYNENIQLGHITQLFPLIEIQVRKLGKMFGIVPFKEKVTEFMKYKDPSSILRILLENAYEEVGSFENVSDLLFVYHFMYNSNSLNIRNECIHGRNYIKGSQIKYAFKVTLLALYMIIFRIKMIEEHTNNDKQY